LPSNRERSIGQWVAHGAIRSYQLSLSMLIGRRCRYLPTCSEYTDDAIAAHGVWPGAWIGLARICRCNPFGGSGFDPPPKSLPAESAWYRPWRYGHWRTPVCEAVEADAPPSP
jgi:putative membrane protein insertion efficiency factor